MSATPLLHPAIIAMIEAGGSTVQAYIDATGGASSYKTRADIGDRSTRHVPMPDLPAHTAGLTHQDEMMMSVHLAPNLRFLTGPNGEGASILMDEHLLPATLGAAVVGRRVAEIIDHPMLRVPGLEVVGVESANPPHTGQIRLRLSVLRWRTS